RSLNAWHRGRPGLLSLRAGEGHVGAAEHAFEGEFRGSLEAGDLLARAPQLGWLRPHVHGGSTWSAGVTVPQGGAGAAAGPAAALTLRSELVGTALELPAPLRKPAALSLPARIEVPLPL